MRKEQTSHKNEHNTLMCFPLEPVFTRDKRRLPNFIDEPVSGLDPKVTAEMYTLIEKLNREDGITVIMISHDVAAAVRYASHILHIGDTVFFGTKAAYLQSPQGRLFAAEKGGDAQ